MDPIADDFTAPLDDRWHLACPGGGTCAVSEGMLRCAIPQTPAGRYANAQIDDYEGRRGRGFSWQPPLRMEVRARTSLPVHPGSTPADAHVDGGPQRYLRGTVGFGFWNAPMTVAGGGLRLPAAVWFFGASPPSEMRLVPGQPGRGWKAQVVNTRWSRTLALGLPAVAGAGWARLTGREAWTSRLVQRVTGTVEAELAELAAGAAEWHDYALEWRRDAAIFWVDGAEVLRAANPPGGPLGFVAWVDNQYALATPRGVLKFGTLATSPQWLELDMVRLTPLG